MKVTLIAFLLASASLAFGQAATGVSALSNEPSVLRMTSHPEHASYVDMGREQTLSEKSTITIAHGERPLWEVAPVHYEVPLGDIARALREEHAKAKKADFIKED
jgi:hypothetical protein